jgi:uncharacterized protein
MKFTLETSSRVNLIRAYSTQQITVGDQVIGTSCIVSADALITQWEPQSVGDLRAHHLEQLFQLSPELVLFGTGSQQQFAPASIRAALAARGIGAESMDLGAACRTFNILVQEERRVAAALFLK